MATITPEEVRELEARTHNFIPQAAEITKPSTFLSLAPSTSSSYPQNRPSRPSVPGTTPGPIPVVSRRTTSVSSNEDDKKTAVRRFLKLGPVHNGEHVDGGKDDWHNVAVI